MRILILDDETKRAQQWKEKLFAVTGADVDVPDPDGVSDLISRMHKARFESRLGHFKGIDCFDGYDLVILDYDLLGLQVDKLSAWATGAELAYCMRLVTSAGPIVVVNQFGTNSFDLTMRRGISSYADVDVGSDQITLPGLWASKEFSGFRPWHWPNLLSEVARFASVKNYIKANLDASIVGALGFDLVDSDAENFIGYEVAAFIGAGHNKAVTFREVVTSEAGLRVFNILEKDRPILDCMPEEQVAILSAAIVIHWLEKVVLPSQETIMDLPHLCLQVPWVVAESSDLDAWDSLCNINDPVISDDLKPFEFVPSFFFSRPVFWGVKARNRLFAPNEFIFDDMPDIQFCENTSRFAPTESCSDYPSDVLAFDKKRWISKENLVVTGGNYEPQSYLLM